MGTSTTVRKRAAASKAAAREKARRHNGQFGNQVLSEPTAALDVDDRTDLQRQADDAGVKAWWTDWVDAQPPTDDDPGEPGGAVDDDLDDDQWDDDPDFDGEPDYEGMARDRMYGDGSGWERSQSAHDDEFYSRFDI